MMTMMERERERENIMMERTVGRTAKENMMMEKTVGRTAKENMMMERMVGRTKKGKNDDGKDNKGKNDEGEDGKGCLWLQVHIKRCCKVMLQRCSNTFSSSGPDLVLLRPLVHGVLCKEFRLVFKWCSVLCAGLDLRVKVHWVHCFVGRFVSRIAPLGAINPPPPPMVKPAPALPAAVPPGPVSSGPTPPKLMPTEPKYPPPPKPSTGAGLLSCHVMLFHV